MEKTKLAICVNFKGVDFISDYDFLSTDEEKVLINLCQKASNGELSNLTFTSKNKRYFFPKEIIVNSIISIVSDKA